MNNSESDSQVSQKDKHGCPDQRPWNAKGHPETVKW